MKIILVMAGGKRVGIYVGPFYFEIENGKLLHNGTVSFHEQYEEAFRLAGQAFEFGLYDGYIEKRKPCTLY